MNSTFDAVIVITVVCGLLMVVGGMVLLYKGTITLKDSNPDEAIQVEFKHMINVTTRYPALALFVIGLVFTVVALYFAQSEGLPDSQSMELYKPTIQPMRQSLFHFQCITARRIRMARSNEQSIQCLTTLRTRFRCPGIVPRFAGLC
jgi:hypothetical protein